MAEPVLSSADANPDPHLAILLDPALLSAAVGVPVRATRLRPKPGVKHVAALADPTTGQPVGWVQVLIGSSRVKVDKAHLVAEQLGLGDQVHERELPSGALLVWGSVETDPRLGRAAHELNLAGATVLRYNPLRRLVVRVDDSVVRVSAAPHRRRWIEAVRALTDHGIPVLRPATAEQARATGLRPSRRVSVWQWVEGRDLSHAATEEEQRSAGELLARVHRVPTTVVPDLEHRGWREVRGSAEATVAQLEQVAPEVARTARAVLEDLPSDRGEDSHVLLHGDFSLDQCLASTDGGVVLGDLDRLCHGPVEVDLGSMWAVALIEGASVQAVQDAYGAPAPHACWVVAALLSRVTEPWRAQDEGWAQEVERRSALAAAVLAEGLVRRAAGWRAPSTVQAGGDSIEVHRAWPDGERPRVAVEGPDQQGRLRAATLDLDGRVRLHPPGEDPKLPALADVAGRGRLVVHRAGRRAVVALPDRYAKVLRPGRAASVATASETGARLVQAVGLAAPEVLRHDESMVELSVLPGGPVHVLHDDPAWPQIWEAWAAAWTALQALGTGSGTQLTTGLVAGLARHTPVAEAQVLRTWSARAEVTGMLRGTPWPARLEETAQQLPETAQQLDESGLVVTHRDLHDQQLLWDGSRLGVLDLDTLCLAEPALDPVNLKVHADLRHAQGLWPAVAVPTVVEAVERVLAAASVGEDRRRLAERATVARLAAVYAFRPRWREQVLTWADRRWGQLDT